MVAPLLVSVAVPILAGICLAELCKKRNRPVTFVLPPDEIAAIFAQANRATDRIIRRRNIVDDLNNSGHRLEGRFVEQRDISEQYINSLDEDDIRQDAIDNLARRQFQGN